MNSDPKVTVPVPAFNVEPYLRQCLGTLRELEVLLCDDGSTDGCPAICAVRLFCKTQIKGSVIKYRILCGLIRFHKKAILPHPAEMLPNLGGKLSDPDSLS